MTPVYVAGEISSILQGQYEQNAVLETHIKIDGEDYQLRSPIGCRSFVHPAAGFRVSRTKGEWFEFKLTNGMPAFIRVSYSCRESDAKIFYGVQSLVSVYRLIKDQSLVIVRDYAIPPEYESNPPVVFLNGKLDTTNPETNTTRTEKRITDIWKEKKALPLDAVFLSISSRPIRLKGSIIHPRDVEEIEKLQTTQFLPKSAERWAIDRLVATKTEESTGFLYRILEEVPFKFSADDFSFSPDAPHFGRRTYYSLPVSSDCPGNTSSWTNASCRRDKTITKVGNFTVSNKQFGLIYNPEKQIVYWRNYEQL